MSDYCMFPNQCGAGMDCSACMGNEISRLKERIQKFERFVSYVIQTEKRADGCVGFVDNPQIKALRAIAKNARELLPEQPKAMI